MNQPVRPEDVRIGDSDREAVAGRLGRAQAEGRLDLAEYDARLQAAYAARTAGELARVTADLPAERGPQAVQPARPGKAERRRTAQRAAVASWASVSTVTLLIWAVTCIASASWIYPWWIWVAGPWGAVLLAGWIGGRVAGVGPDRR
ncbi:DUF1707 SHOCT-like domain-containing protein [Pseudonocardia sp.]|uniref:DUF1707 SHOCT-like domain-containing protein n=1 Tax=Pseudonocardia sp. TaxID=60912 RepID=UPI003D0E7512